MSKFSVLSMEMDKAEDYALIDRFLSGAEEAFDMLVRRHQNRVINIVYSLTGQNPHAQDIAQEVFIKVYSNLGTFEKKAAFSTWLYRITVNTTYNYLKARREHVSLDDIQEPEDSRKTSLAELEQKERQGLISKAIESLPFKYRKILVLKDIEGLAYIDIAKVVGCRIGTVESRLFRARLMLKKILTPLMEESRL